MLSFIHEFRVLSVFFLSIRLRFADFGFVCCFLLVSLSLKFDVFEFLDSFDGRFI